MNGIQKTYSMKEAEIAKKWVLINADGKILGRVATEIVNHLRGKNKPTFMPNIDMGDNVIVINAEKVVLTGNKAEDKDYFTHSKYPGGKKFTNIKKLMLEKPEYILEHAVKGMMPKTKLCKNLLGNLKIYKGAKHPHEAQKPETINL
jgi:large subunit ribosomal protein L13